MSESSITTMRTLKRNDNETLENELNGKQRALKEKNANEKQ